jgi:iron complex outermembrane receptor protein
VEASATLNTQFSTFNLSYCYLHQDKDLEEHLQSQYSLEYLRHKLTAQLQMHIAERLNLTVNYRWQDRMGSYTDTDGQIQPYHPYSVVDARLAWDADTYSIYIAGNNLTCHRYVDYGNVRQPGLWLTVGAKVSLY